MFTRKHADTDQHEHDAGSEETRTPSHARESLGGREYAKEQFGGVNLGSACFGWLVAIALTLLLAGAVGAIAAAVSAGTQVTQSDAERSAGTIGIAAAIVLVVVLAIAYYAGGYVAGRMSRFDGARQGLAVFFIGLLITLLAVALGALFGDQYNVLNRVDLPQMPIPSREASIGGLITGVVVLVVTALSAMSGGKVGRNYHRKVDAAHYEG